MGRSSFVQSLPECRIEDLLREQLFLSKYGGISVLDSNRLTRKDVEILTENLEEWLRDEAKVKVQRDEAFLRALAKMLQSLFGGR